jgi:dTDP-4-amino-4,6-dideoxygalactose transaminase
MGRGVAVRKIGIHDPWITEADLLQLRQALDSNWISGGGENNTLFERAIADFLGIAEPAISTVNGSSALLLALKATGFRRDEHMLVSSYGFIATANAVRHAGGEPIFLGPAKPFYPVVTFDQVKNFFASEVDSVNRFRRTGKTIHGFLYNEPYGLASADLEEIARFLENRELILIEDASQAVGVRLGDRMLGTIGQAAVFSFNGNKTLTVGAGGAMVSGNSSWNARARKLHSQSRSDEFDFFYGEEAHNFQLSNVLAGFGLSQMERLPEILERKLRIRRDYRKALERSGWSLLAEEVDYPAWLNIAVTGQPKTRGQMRELAGSLEGEGIRVRPVFPPVTANSVYEGAVEFFPEHNRDLFDRGICLPSGPLLSQSDVQRICDALIQKGKALGFN